MKRSAMGLFGVSDKLFHSINMLNFCVNTFDNYDIDKKYSLDYYLLDLDKYKNNIIDIIFSIKTKNSLAKIFVVMRKKSFSQCLKLFRLGISDIVFEYYSIKKLHKIFSQHKMEIIQNLIYVDDVTELYNQRKFKKDIEYLIKEKRIFSVLFIDVDHFKNINDTHGHVMGGLSLVQLAAILKENIRETDFIYRYGGDEFVVLLPMLDNQKALILATRILDIINNKNIIIKYKNVQTIIKLSISIGVGEFPKDGKDKDTILGFADKMMYQAKTNGRGQVYHTSLL